jgi:hypothetical protein
MNGSRGIFGIETRRDSRPPGASANRLRRSGTDSTRIGASDRDNDFAPLLVAFHASALPGSGRVLRALRAHHCNDRVPCPCVVAHFRAAPLVPVRPLPRHRHGRMGGRPRRSPDCFFQSLGYSDFRPFWPFVCQSPWPVVPAGCIAGRRSMSIATLCRRNRHGQAARRISGEDEGAVR